VIDVEFPVEMELEGVIDVEVPLLVEDTGVVGALVFALVDPDEATDSVSEVVGGNEDDIEEVVELRDAWVLGDIGADVGDDDPKEDEAGVEDGEALELGLDMVVTILVELPELDDS